MRIQCGCVDDSSMNLWEGRGGRGVVRGEKRISYNDMIYREGSVGWLCCVTYQSQCFEIIIQRMSHNDGSRRDQRAQMGMNVSQCSGYRIQCLFGDSTGRWSWSWS